MGTAQQENPVIYCVEEQQATWLFANLAEAIEFNRSRADDHNWSKVKIFCSAEHKFSPKAPEVSPLDFGPGQEKCKRISRHIHRWWKARDAWWDTLA